MLFEEQLKQMLGRTFLYNTRLYKIANYDVFDGKVTIATDKKFFRFSRSAAEKELKKFLPVAEEEKAIVLRTMPESDKLVSLSKIVLDNIEKLKEDKGYIHQANAINKSINTLINMAKLELKMLDMQRKNEER